MHSILFSGLSLCGVVVMRQSGPRKCVSKFGITHVVFTVQYCGAGSSCYFSQLCFTKGGRALSLRAPFLSGYFSINPAIWCFNVLQTILNRAMLFLPRTWFSLNGMYIRLPNDGFSALLFLIFRTVQFDKHFIWETSSLKSVYYSKKSLRST